MLAILLLPLLPSILALPTAPLRTRSSSSNTSTSTSPIEYLTSSWPSTPFTHLSTFSPWHPSPGAHGIPSSDLPEECSLDMVQVYMRHGEREATGKKQKGIAAAAEKIAGDWDWATDDENLKYLSTWTWTEPTAYLLPLGSATAFAAGVAFQNRYKSLLPDYAYFNWTGVDNIPVRSTPVLRRTVQDEERVHHTAQSFTSGFLGPNYLSRSTWQITPDSDSSFNSTLSPHNCPALDTVSYSSSDTFNDYFLPKVLERLNPLLPEGLNLTEKEVQGLMNACPFDSFRLQRPSPICGLFTEEEWKGYEWAIELTQNDKAGYGGPLGTIKGAGWVTEMIARLNNTYPTQVASINSTLSSSPSTFPLESPIYLDFGHDTTLESIITAMGLLRPEEAYSGNITLEEIDEGRRWKSSVMAPMGARLVVERMSCSGSSAGGTYVKMILNDATLPLKDLDACATSWGADQGLCGLEAFIESQAYALAGAGFSNCSNSE
ncbi:hypothetical protein L202_01964 [Cryptococcus amylolentus CBS 6039]|uniref:Acid phosphatase n=1 Tax=Cryptococcus amylolentus CBS 6039 TaxID=1295533 RepID=A0A1E3HZC5_9TREE|nr:hypothetical protein L202_01964 [Cryptococcus amylolentus CBS 6039]ODN81545.1 hypothetical protein L202_01964 [Cryptococcus amylolentus CBS 6039]